MYDPKNSQKSSKQKCQKNINPVDECLYQNLKSNLNCDPLSKTANKTCPKYIESPVQNILPYEKFYHYPEESGSNSFFQKSCYPENCDQKFIKIESTAITPKIKCPDAANKFNFKTSYTTEIFEACQKLPSGQYKKLMELKNRFAEYCYDLSGFSSGSTTSSTTSTRSYNTMTFCQFLTGKKDYSKNSFTKDDINQKIFSSQNYDKYSFNLGYNSFFINLTEEQYLDTWIETIIDILGMAGFWLGFSFVTILEFFTLVGTLVLSGLHVLSDESKRRNSIYDRDGSKGSVF